MEHMDRLAEAERRIGHRFTDRDLLAKALRHASSADDRLESNERLEFLGDSVLGLVVGWLLGRFIPWHDWFA